MFKNIILIVLSLWGAFSYSQPHCVYLNTDIYPGSYGASPISITEFNGALYFRATGNSSGPELWKYENGMTSMVADISPGAGGSMPNQLTVMGSNLYFTAITAATGLELFKFDGTTVSVAADIFPGSAGSQINYLTVVGSELYFSANDGVSGYEPWKYDGTTASLVADINPGSASSNPDEYAGAGGFVYFPASNPTYGFELWKYDGVTAVVNDLYPGTQGSDIGEITAVGSQVCFRATNGTQGYELWTHDGVSPTCLDVCVTGAGDFTPWDFTSFGSAVYFRGFNAATGYELWKYDGATASMVADIFPGGGNAHPNHLMPAATVMYFAANDGVSGNELWVYDGTSTSLVSDINPGANSSILVAGADKFLTIGDEVYFIADNGVTGIEIWGYDGTSAFLGRDILPGSSTSNPTGLTSYGNSVFFLADDITAGAELWEWDLDQVLTGSLNVDACDDYTSPSGNVYSGEGVYDFLDTIPSINCPGCDSIIDIHLTITYPVSSFTVHTCDDYISPAGDLYSTPGNYVFTDTISSITCPGVDSIIDINLTIIANLNTAIFATDGVVFVAQAGATYQWLDCDAGMAPIAGEIDQDYIPVVTGNYACEITLGSCIDTTACVFVVSTFGVGFDDAAVSEISVYPNPVSGQLMITNSVASDMVIRIINSSGEVVFSNGALNTDQMQVDMSEYATGLYQLEISTQGGKIIRKIVKE